MLKIWKNTAYALHLDLNGLIFENRSRDSIMLFIAIGLKLTFGILIKELFLISQCKNHYVVL